MIERDKRGFDNGLYVEKQLEAFNDRLCDGSYDTTIVEFGGKPFGDEHAARVLPGYDPDAKAEIVRSLQDDHAFSSSIVVNARDIFLPPNGRTSRGRIRGDSGLRYDLETIRLVIEARNRHGINIGSVALAVLPPSLSPENTEKAGLFVDSVFSETGLEVKKVREVPEYPDPLCITSPLAVQAFESSEPLSEDPKQNIMLLSAGGGSGKFGVALTEARARATKGVSSRFVKFETFPVFGLASDHPLNLAFIAATADLGNQLSSHPEGTNYDKDDENYILFNALAMQYPDCLRGWLAVKSQFDFGVNVVELGIVDEDIIRSAATKEIRRRVARYSREVASGDECSNTLETVESIARKT